MSDPAKSIRVGTMISASAGKAAERIAEIADLGFESFEPFFWQSTNGQDIAELGKRSLDAIGPRHLFVDAGLAETLCGVQGLVSVQPLVWWHGGADFARIDLEIAEYDDGPLDPRESAPRRA